ncbi:CehA/McbA family metallohydrolase [Pseudofrankia saprophytica]|uniref:CehA/McbA family metallohydrolase n=1 Tax=Pseudofrankia saprophytica TaxID=298655 RepID=UPI000234BFE4|nr:CehA/McbA family metallohydrolase [Pseudofrankia saprophytica]
MCGHHGIDSPCQDLAPEAVKADERRYVAERYPDADRPDADRPHTGGPLAARPVAPAGPSRRRVLTVAGLGGGALLAGGASAFGLAACSDDAGAGGPTPRATVTSFPPTRTVVLTGTVASRGEYVYLPFDVGPGVNRVQVSMAKADPTAKLGIGLFDHRGPAYGSPGFRGIYGEERSSFFVAADSASQSFLPGPVEPGRWTVIVPVFAVQAPSQVTVTVTLSGGPAPAKPFTPGATVGTVLARPGWYRGDLHCHTPESSDAWNQKTALTPAAWANTCRQLGLDFVAMTDHNVVSQNLFLARDAGSDVLLMPGEEMTNWSFGHATVSGIDVGDWLDFRQTPEGTPLPENGARIDKFLATARDLGAYVAAAHPSFPGLKWQFGAEMERPAGRPVGYELWTGSYGPDDEQSVQAWDGMLRKGWRVCANGGSDLHGVESGAKQGFRAGTPTTVVYADALETKAVIAALRAGRSFVTRRPDGVECYLTASRERQRAIVGGEVFGASGDPVGVQVRVRRAGGMRATVITQAGTLSTTAVTSDDQTIEATIPIPPGGGYVRVEVRGGGHTHEGLPLATEGDMECLTNPIWLTVGDPPASLRPMTAPPPARPGPRRVTAG